MHTFSCIHCISQCRTLRLCDLLSTQARTTTNNALLPALPAIKAYMQVWYGSSCCKASWPSRTCSLRQSQIQGFGRQPLNGPPLLNMLIARCGNGLTTYSMSGNADFHVQQWALPFVVPNTRSLCPTRALGDCWHLAPITVSLHQLQFQGCALQGGSNLLGPMAPPIPMVSDP